VLPFLDHGDRSLLRHAAKESQADSFCAVELHPVLLGEVHEALHLALGVVHHRCELRELRSQLVGRNPPLRVDRLRGVLGEDRVDQRVSRAFLWWFIRPGSSENTGGLALPRVSNPVRMESHNNL